MSKAFVPGDHVAATTGDGSWITGTIVHVDDVWVSIFEDGIYGPIDPLDLDLTSPGTVVERVGR